MMSTKKVIRTPDREVVNLIKKEVNDKKERHKKFIKSINPAIIQELNKTKKV